MMTDLLQSSQLPPPHIGAVRRRRGLVLSVGLAIGLVAAVGVGAGVSRSDSSRTDALAPVQLASMHQACAQWTGSSAPQMGTLSASAACVTMTDWMGQQVRSGRMTGTMMFGDATAMGSTCGAWQATGAPSVGSGAASAWCADMVRWMTGHIGNWDEWMAHGRMMG